MKAVTRHCDSDARDCRDGDNVYGVIRLLLHSAMTQQPRERSGLEIQEEWWSSIKPSAVQPVSSALGSGAWPPLIVIHRACDAMPPGLRRPCE